jgi:hypothetical protein
LYCSSNTYVGTSLGSLYPSVFIVFERVLLNFFFMYEIPMFDFYYFRVILLVISTSFESVIILVIVLVVMNKISYLSCELLLELIIIRSLLS